MIKSSELIINKDGSIFHLHLKPENIADDILLVGDPGRVELVASNFDSIECKISNREFMTITGVYNGKRITVLSTGIGTDNIDIVVNELDALVNIDLETRTEKAEKRKLNLIRIGTSGGLQTYLPVNSYVVSRKSIGFDGLLNYYAKRDEVGDLDFEKAFVEHTEWLPQLPAPYVMDCSNVLYDRISGEDTFEGVTISAPGFYGPQGRKLRLDLADPQLNNKVEAFSFNELKITNFEMESSALYGLSKLLGHHALCICLIIANRVVKEANESYHEYMKKLIKLVLDRLTA
ncbi:phosphorylase [Prolixibacteraceae bacterium JC049]|nr:phosphorylase [Prolixibacteraceae bacterium JC049]